MQSSISTVERYKLMESHHVKITEQLIKLVKPHPELYDVSSQLYNDRAHVDELWASISQTMQMSTTEVRTKWNSLRSQFMRALKHENMPFGASGRRRKKWYMMDSLDFLRGVLAAPTTSESTSRDKNEEAFRRLPMFPEIPVVVMKQESQSADSEPELEITPSSEKRSRLSSQSAEGHQQISNTQVPDDSYPSSGIFDDHSGSLSHPNNYDQLFFQSLDEDIKRLAPHRRRRLKEIFLQTLNNLLDQQEMEHERNSVARVFQERAQH
ncbi:hypothetical protein DMENIID0001_013480 [Sergentomyia squamirostris]